jgi:hypothetical protein
MTKTEVSLNGVHYVFYGPNATLINWIKNSDLARTVRGTTTIRSFWGHKEFLT